MSNNDCITGLDALEAEFWNKFEQLVDLVGKARRTELLLRISIDANARSNAFKKTRYSDYAANSLDNLLIENLKLIKKQFGRQLEAFFADSVLAELNSIREVAGALAHAQIHQTRKKVKTHLKNYSCSNKLNNDIFPGILFQNLTDEDGSKCNISYHPNPSSYNSTMLEWELFIHHGFDVICSELFCRATDIVKAKFSNIVLEEDMSRVMVALKLGKRFPIDKD